MCVCCCIVFLPHSCCFCCCWYVLVHQRRESGNDSAHLLTILKRHRTTKRTRIDKHFCPVHCSFTIVCLYFLSYILLGALLFKQRQSLFFFRARDIQKRQLTRSHRIWDVLCRKWDGKQVSGSTQDIMCTSTWESMFMFLHLQLFPLLNCYLVLVAYQIHSIHLSFSFHPLHTLFLLSYLLSITLAVVFCHLSQFLSYYSFEPFAPTPFGLPPFIYHSPSDSSRFHFFLSLFCCVFFSFFSVGFYLLPYSLFPQRY